MARIRIALAQFDFPVGDVAGNAKRVVELAERARDELDARLVLFPELCLSGYLAE
ncbi:MAG TPA: nitrilase-related carbon-nitrogen hydrolase, partial [Xanthomonadales bacterium]|nr:nitrilase-related carbon-nitrogen hydrolase [Xanthomonadales bacterium]